MSEPWPGPRDITKMKRRRSTRRLEELPSLFGEEEIYGDRPIKGPVIIEPILGEKTAADEDAGSDPLTLSEDFAKPLRRLRFMSFGSGSSGNCAYIGTDDCGLIIDAGVDNNRVIDELVKNGVKLSSIQGILLTHDHGDHVRYAYALVRKYKGWKVYATPRTIEGIFRRHNISRRLREYHAPIYKEHEYIFNNLKIIPFATSHDGTDNVGFFISYDDKKFVVCTDTGCITDRADFYLRQANAIMIESNYDEQMLINGPYKEYLKSRINSEMGHLDNKVTARYVSSIYRNELTHIFLCHLSEENNTPETALATMTEALLEKGIRLSLSPSVVEPGTVYLAALPRFSASDLYVF